MAGTPLVPDCIPPTSRRQLFPEVLLILAPLIALTGPVGSPRPPQESPRVGPQPGRPFTNSVGMRFVWLDPGTFLMGSPDGKVPPGVPAEEGRDTDEKPHRVTLTKGYHLGAHLVTQEQWQSVMGRDADHSNFKGKDADARKRLPVDNVSWFDCVEFCVKLSVREGRKPRYRLARVRRDVSKAIKAADVELLAGATGYRLPTEAQWEYACRSATTTPFWCGTTLGTDRANYDGTYIYGKEGRKGVFRARTTPVQHFEANRWGLFDMHGNLEQWCEDRYGPYPAGDVKDPQGPERGAVRVLRGGSWYDGPALCRAACRDTFAPDRRAYVAGCRVCLCPGR